jgi:pyruvate dehydrogenase E2 component (dihydrolipoamide acetyltransferase)
MRCWLRREQINAAAHQEKEGKPAYKLSVNDFVIKALALALRDVPDGQCLLDGETRYGEAQACSDVGVAVSIPGGLITPVRQGGYQDAVAKSPPR